MRDRSDTRYKKNKTYREKALKRAKTNYKENPQKFLDRVAFYYKKNPDQWRARNAKYKAEKFSANGSHTWENIASLFNSQDGRCKVCSKDLNDGYQLDHIMPLCRGGSNDSENLQLLCEPCNRSKGRKTMSEWGRAVA
jgi:5-methylcytosine-specific restriction endonuclease McrA